jgi:hypothetical protein
MVQVAIPVLAVGFRKNKEKVNISGNCIFPAYGEQTSLNRLLSFLHISDLADVINCAKFRIDRSVKGLRNLRCCGAPKIACSHRKAESFITLHCTAVHAVILEPRIARWHNDSDRPAVLPARPGPARPGPARPGPAVQWSRLPTQPASHTP